MHKGFVLQTSLQLNVKRQPVKNVQIRSVSYDRLTWASRVGSPLTQASPSPGKSSGSTSAFAKSERWS